MEMEQVALSQRERDRLRVLHEIKRKHLAHEELPVSREAPRATSSFW